MDMEAKLPSPPFIITNHLYCTTNVCGTLKKIHRAVVPDLETSERDKARMGQLSEQMRMGQQGRKDLIKKNVFLRRFFEE